LNTLVTTSPVEPAVRREITSGAARGSILITNIGCLSTPSADEASDAGGRRVEHIEEAYILILDGCVAETGSGTPPPRPGIEQLDAGGRAAIPALADPHTHCAFAGWRADEFLARLDGASYKEILAQGGGILATVRATRAAGEERLATLVRARLDAMLARGVLTCEVKSGYGLTVESELEMLRAVRRAARDHPVEVVPTYLAAHAVPPEFSHNAEEYIDQVVLPGMEEARAEGLAEYVDVFCEPGAFTLDQSERILRAGSDLGLGLRLHADELEKSGGARLAAELGAASADHLLAASEEDLQALGRAGTCAVLLPGTAFMLRRPYAAARWMLDHGLTVALATDYNPGSSPIIDLHLVMTLACLGMGMRPDETLCACSASAARSLGRPDRGIIAPGYRGDVVLVDAPTYHHLVYRPGARLVWAVIKEGTPVYRAAVHEPQLT